MRLRRVKDLALHHVGIPLYAPIHYHKLRRWRRQTLPHIERLAREANRSRGGPLILLARHQHMGDVLMASAVIRHLRQLHPDATLIFATQPRYRALVAHNPRLDHVVDCGCVGTVLPLAAHPAFDASHVLLPAETQCELCGAAYRETDASLIARKIDDRHWFRHGRHLLDLMFERLGIENADRTPEIFIPESVVLQMRGRLEGLLPRSAAGLVAMHMRTPHWPAKEWPAARFAALIKRLTAEFGVQVIAIGSERAIPLPEGTIDLTGQTSMLETAALLAEVDLFVGLDSGPSHLASAVGAASVILFGPTDPATCRPLGAKVTTLWHGSNEDGLFTKELRAGAQANRDIAKITVDEVVNAIRPLLAQTRRYAVSST